MHHFPRTPARQALSSRVTPKSIPVIRGQIAQRGWRAQASKAQRAPRKGIGTLRLCPAPGRLNRATLLAGSALYPCAIGTGGCRAAKREGDGATPRGTFRLVSAFYRPDRGPRPCCPLPLHSSAAHDGWCDDPADPRYNRPVRLPVTAGHERMWRDDRLYDLGLVVDYNLRPARRRLGSAIFIHVMAPGGRPTAGCVALRPGDLRRLIPRLASRCHLLVP